MSRQPRVDSRGRRTRWPLAEERFEQRYAVVGECWEWDVPHPQSGYGTIWDSVAGKNVLAHRWSYEHFIAPIPRGLEIDHLCRNRRCVNPAHLEPVTSGENTRRGYWGLRTHCNHGHEFTDENTMRDKKGSRLCRQCKRERDRAYRQRSAS